MEKFVPATINNSEAQLSKIVADLKIHFPERAHEAEQIAREQMEKEKQSLIFINDKYQVSVKKIQSPIAACDIIWLSIKRLDRQSLHDWRELQQIKNELVGEENEAIEIYPAESRVVDTSNQYHLWVFSDPTYRIPLGFNERMVSDVSVGGSKQRPLGSVNIKTSTVKTNKGVFKKKQKKKRR